VNRLKDYTSTSVVGGGPKLLQICKKGSMCGGNYYKDLENVVRVLGLLESGLIPGVGGC